MTLRETANINDLRESADIEAEIRQRHQPYQHGNAPCPSGGCCMCQPPSHHDGCDAGLLIVMLDRARQRPTAPPPALGPAGEGDR